MSTSNNCSEDEGELPEIERIRLESVKMLDNFIEEALKNPEMKDVFGNLNGFQQKPASKPSVPKRSGDPSCTFHVRVDRKAQPRRSKRLANFTTDLNERSGDDTDSEKENISEESLGEDSDDEVVVSRRRTSIKRSEPVPAIPVEEVTETYLRNIATKGMAKAYSDRGTSCHQCRQKTLDSKTVCRSGHCIGVRGQFCGVCLLNRYGEDATKALKNPDWACPPCRRICNCSICRTRQGKMPTGIMVPMAKEKGYNNVKDFLVSIKEKDRGRKTLLKIDNIVKKKSKKRTFDDKDAGKTSLLGFTKEFHPVLLENEYKDHDYDVLGFMDERAVYLQDDDKNYLLIGDIVAMLERKLNDDMEKLAVVT